MRRPVRARRNIAACAGAAALLLGGAARAAPQVLATLEYEVAPDANGCSDSEEFGANVARQLRYDPFRADADRRVSVQIARKEAGFEGHIKWTDADGHLGGDRHLKSRSADCREIGASLAFSVAVQIQLLSTLAPPPEPPPPPPPPPAVPTVIAPPPPPPPPAKVPTWSVGLGPALAIGVAPETTGLARLFVSGRRDRFSLELAVDAALPATRHEVDGSGFSLDRFAAGTAGCAHFRMLAGCLTATGGLLRASGVGVNAPASPTGWFSQLGARVAATLDFGDRFFATARVDGLVMLSPWTVTLNDIAAWTTPRVGALIGLDLGARFF